VCDGCFFLKNIILCFVFRLACRPHEFIQNPYNSHLSTLISRQSGKKMTLIRLLRHPNFVRSSSNPQFPPKLRPVRARRGETFLIYVHVGKRNDRLNNVSLREPPVLTKLIHIFFYDFWVLQISNCIFLERTMANKIVRQKY
jgi:hypothetical protein